MRVGYQCGDFVFPGSDEPPFGAMIDLVKRLEDAGFEWFSAMDHFQQIPFYGAPDEPFFNVYSILPAVARETDSMTLGTLATCPQYHNPAVLGKRLTAIDHASGGRLAFGVGAGWNEPEYDTFGFDFPDTTTRITALRDTITLLRTMWTDPSPIDFESETHSFEGVYAEPKPIQSGGPDVIVGGEGEQLLLRVVAELADGWNAPQTVTPRDFDHKCGVLEEYCSEFGTDFDAIEKSVTNNVLIRESADGAREAFRERHPHSPYTDSHDEFHGFVGTVEEVVSLMETYEEYGADMLVLRPVRNDPETIDHLIDTVLPRLN